MTSQKRESKNDQTETKQKINRNDNSYKPFVILATISVLLTSLIIYEIRQVTQLLQDGIDIEVNSKKFLSSTHQSKIVEKNFKFYAYGSNVDGGHLKHVFLVLERLGYERVYNLSDSWDLLWAHDYPFRKFYKELNNLRSHQRVNHFPGCGYITNKVDLSTTKLKYIPRAFKLPDDRDELKKYLETFPKKLLVEKNNEHRNIKIIDNDQIDFDKNGSFIQEFIDRPYLVDGHKFDIGVYTIITSVDPLRVYIYNGDILFRYCMEKYHPFDKNNIDKYVVGDDYLPTWEVPSLKQFYNDYGHGMRDSFNAYARQNGRDPEIIWIRIEDAIRKIILEKENDIVTILQRFKSRNVNFFEMIRFDLIIDEDFNVYVMEANMSPNLSSAHYPPNQLLYEQVLFNMFSLVGVANHIRKSSLAKRTVSEEMMQVAENNLAVNAMECTKFDCKNNCFLKQCQLCVPCLNAFMKEALVNSYKEFVNKGECKRIFPPKMEQSKKDITKEIENLSETNQFIFKWFHQKCQLNPFWCE